MTDAQQLLADYVRQGSEPAFRELVARYVNLVYSTALRLAGGDTHRAEDVVQVVFMDLAAKAPTLSNQVMLGGWLYQHTYHVAMKAVRTEQRRRARENEALQMNAHDENAGNDWRQIAPVLDEAITQLGDDDRAAILLRFFEQQDFRAVGAALGSNEDAARMRVNRAIEKLQVILKRKGVVLPATALGAVLAGEAVTAAPIGLAASVAAAAFTGTSTGTAAVATLTKVMAMTKLQTGIIGALVVAGIAGPVVVYKQAQAKMRADELAMRQQSEQLSALTAENQKLSNQIVDAKNTQALTKSQLDDLLKLRSQVGALKKQLAEVPKTEPVSSHPAARPAAPPDEAQEKYQQAMDQQMAYVKMNSARQWTVAFLMYAADNNGQMPPAFEHAAQYLKNDPSLMLATNEFEVVYQGSLNSISNPSSAIVMREIAVPGATTRAYAFADGHAEIHKSETGDFQDWEAQHTAVPKN